jgi:small subunit ribosomal protein S17
VGERGIKKTQVGIVISNRMDKTVVVEVSRMVKHSSYEKYVKKRARYKAHDSKNECALGDKVLIVEGRPLSRHKNWRVERILEKRITD